VISSLGLTGLGVIEAAELELRPGLNVLTGETGAGKTMVVTSLQLLLGERSSADMVRAGNERARVTAHIDVPADSAVGDRVEAAGGELEGQTVTVVRTISAAGRSRAAVGGAPGPLSLLAEIGQSLITIHGQHDQGRLTSPIHQRALLDRFGGLTELASDVAVAHNELSAHYEEQSLLLSQQQERRREIDLLRFGVAEIEAVSPEEGEDVAAETAERRLAHAVDLAKAAWSVSRAMGEDDDSLVARVADLQRMLDPVRSIDPQLDALASRLDDVGYAVTDLASELASYSESVEADPAQLATVQERRAALTALRRKYGPELSDVLTWAAEAAERLLQLEGSDDRLDTLGRLIASAEHSWAERALALSVARAAAAQSLAEQVTGELSALAMPDAELLVEVSRRQVPGGAALSASVLLGDGSHAVASPTGVDDVAFLLRPHKGAAPLPVQRGASGGELSRVMLAIEVVLADVDPVPTVVFDEVDAGVGGAAAVEVGRRLAQLGRSRQVLVVTHLPQVAAFADHHWLVSKTTDGEVTSSDVFELADAARVKELTRMLSGLTDSASGHAHAEELLAVARAES
jgi:DNA repair protein RecN (Recombination protein N)